MEKCGSRCHSTTSFSENVELAETSYEIYVGSFYHFLSGEGVTFSSKGNSANFSSKNGKMTFSGKSII